MTALDTSLRPTATRLIAQFGKPMTLIKPAVDAYDPLTGRPIGIVDTSTSIKGVVEAYSTDAIGRSGGLIQSGDVKVTIGGESVIPEPDDKITIDADDWKVINVDATYSGEQVAIYTMQVRR